LAEHGIADASYQGTGTPEIEPFSIFAAVECDGGRKLATARKNLQLRLEISPGKREDAVLVPPWRPTATETLQPGRPKAAHRRRIAQHSIRRFDFPRDLIWLNAVLGEIAASAFLPLGRSVPGLVQSARFGRGERQLKLHLLASPQQHVVHHRLDHLFRVY